MAGSKIKKKLDKGLVILFEGIDGVGKTTQLELARQELIKQGWPVHATRNLGGTPIGELLREVAFSSVKRSAKTDLYISVAIQTALAEALEAERRHNKIILVDRGPLTLAAYHIYGNGVDEELGWRYADEGMNLFKPDLVILYEADLELALGRAKLRAGRRDYYAAKPRSYFERVEDGYQAANKRYGALKIDGSRSIEAVHAATMAAIDKFLAD